MNLTVITCTLVPFCKIAYGNLFIQTGELYVKMDRFNALNLGQPDSAFTTFGGVDQVQPVKLLSATVTRL